MGAASEGGTVMDDTLEVLRAIACAIAVLAAIYVPLIIVIEMTKEGKQ
jgi:hypothetical protein